MNSKNSTLIGFSILFILFLAYSWLNSPSQKDINKYKAEMKKYRDSIALSDSLSKLAKDKNNLSSDSLSNIKASLEKDSTKTAAEKDSILQNIEKTTVSASKAFANFSSSTGCDEKEFTIENDKLIVTFSNIGGRIKSVKIKGFKGYNHSTKDKYDFSDVVLMNHKADKFSYFIPVSGAARGGVNTQDLCFEPKLEGKAITFRAYTDVFNAICNCCTLICFRVPYKKFHFAHPYLINSLK
jgi:YidC/Oxa1 family membrane protein insertase